MTSMIRHHSEEHNKKISIALKSRKHSDSEWRRRTSESLKAYHAWHRELMEQINAIPPARKRKLVEQENRRIQSGEYIKCPNCKEVILKNSYCANCGGNLPSKEGVESVEAPIKEVNS